MLTGDNRRTALAVAKQVGLDASEADVSPAEKVAYGTFVLPVSMWRWPATALTTLRHSAKRMLASPWGLAPMSQCRAVGITLVSGDLRGIAKAIRLSLAR